MPAYNPGEVIMGVVEKAIKHADAIVIVDDGCDSENRAHLERCRHHPGVTLFRQPAKRRTRHAMVTG
ncbi:MAG: glycosyltransferase family 2 protein, partial [Gammaproteobacteria bacterium]|nr:glycosyltransferase family 2 protein [Gammaproteobacteria bacterium]